MIYLTSLLGFVAVGLLMLLAIKTAEKYKKEPEMKGGKNRNSRRHKR
jgi:hypothetical protein